MGVIAVPPCLPSFVSLRAWLPLPPCLLHDLHSGLLLATALSPKLVSLHDLHSGLLLAAAGVLSPRLVSRHDLHSGLLLAAAAALSPKLVVLHDHICLVLFYAGVICLPVLVPVSASSGLALHSLSFVPQLLRECYLGSMPV